MKTKTNFIDGYFDEIVNDLRPTSYGRALWNLILMTVPAILLTLDVYGKYLTFDEVSFNSVWAAALSCMCVIGGIKFILARRGYGCLATLVRIIFLPYVGLFAWICFVILDIGYLLGIKN